jgi:DUF2958 family protein
MKLLTQSQKNQLRLNNKITQENENHNPVPVVKLFNPWGSATWLLTELKDNRCQPWKANAKADSPR